MRDQKHAADTPERQRQPRGHGREDGPGCGEQHGREDRRSVEVAQSGEDVACASTDDCRSARRAAQREPYGEQRFHRQQRPFVHQRDDEECKRPRDCAPDRDEQQPVKESGEPDERVGEPGVEIAADNGQDRGDDEQREVHDEAEGVDGAARTRVVAAGRKEHHASAPVRFRR